MMYGPNADSWMLLKWDAAMGKLLASMGGSTQTFGPVLNNQHQLFQGDYNGDGREDLAIYKRQGNAIYIAPTSASGQFTSWGSPNLVGDFGDLLDGHHLLFTADFSGDGKHDMGFVYDDHDNWFVGTSSGSALTWAHADTEDFTESIYSPGATLHTFHQRDFNGDGFADVLITFPTMQWRMGLFNGTAFGWGLAGMAPISLSAQTQAQTHLAFGECTGDTNLDALLYDNNTGNWHLGTSNGVKFTWTSAGNRADLLDGERKILDGDFDGDGKPDVLTFDPGNNKWVLGKLNGSNVFEWSDAATHAVN
jgi:hypothetical protein